jgi:hypothetical protein
MFRKNALTILINWMLLGPVGLQLSDSGYIIASS